MTFGERLAQLREAKGWSQTDLAGRAGMKPSAVSHFECGRREPRLANVMRIIEALRCDANELLGTSHMGRLREACEMYEAVRQHISPSMWNLAEGLAQVDRLLDRAATQAPTQIAAPESRTCENPQESGVIS